MLPKFLIAGSAKSGSSTLYHYLSSHPEVFMPELKEPAYFSKHYKKNISWYESIFFDAKPGQIAGEATVEYMVEPESAARILKDIPDVRLIFILRNPIDRAWSHYWHRVKNGEETRDFAEILACKNIDQEYMIRYGSYYRCLKRYYELFDEKQIKVIILEEAKKDFPTQIKDLYSFIGVSTEHTPMHIKAKNKSAMHKYSFLARTSAKIRQFNALKEVLPNVLLQPMRTIFKRINNANMKDWEYPEIKESHREQLKIIFSDDVKSLNAICPNVSHIWSMEDS